MCVLNNIDHFDLVMDVIDRVPGLAERAAYAKQALCDKLIDDKECIRRTADDMPEIKDWAWGGQGGAGDELDRRGQSGGVGDPGLAENWRRQGVTRGGYQVAAATA